MAKAQFENHSLQTTTLLAFLTKSTLGKHFTSIEKHQDWFALTLSPSGGFETQLVPKLKRLLTLPETLQSEITSLTQVVADIIAKHSTGEIEDRNTCIDVIKRHIGKQTHRLNLETGTVEIETTPSIVSIFSDGLRNNPFIDVTFHNKKITFKLYPYFLQRHALCVLEIQDQSVLFFNDTWIPRNEILLIEEDPLPDGSIRVTPHVRVSLPQHTSKFILSLDCSDSMKTKEKINSIEKSRWEFIKESALKFGRLIFDRDPSAQILVNKFGTEASVMLSFSTFESFEKLMNVYTRDGGETHLTKACSTALAPALIDSNNYYNILVFTDGAEIVNNKATLDLARMNLKETLSHLTPEQRTRIKFFIISYTDQRTDLKELPAAFNSAFIVYQSSGLLDALQDHNQLSNFATRHDLFTVRTTIKDTYGTETSNTAYKISIAQESQISALQPTLVHSGDHLTISLTDSAGRERASVEQRISAKISDNNTMQNVFSQLKTLSRFKPSKDISDQQDQKKSNMRFNN